MKQSRAGDVLPRNKVSNSFASPGPPSSSSSSPRKKGTTLNTLGLYDDVDDAEDASGCNNTVI